MGQWAGLKKSNGRSEVVSVLRQKQTLLVLIYFILFHLNIELDVAAYWQVITSYLKY